MMDTDTTLVSKSLDVLHVVIDENIRSSIDSVFGEVGFVDSLDTIDTITTYTKILLHPFGLVFRGSL